MSATSSATLNILFSAPLTFIASCCRRRRRRVPSAENDAFIHYFSSVFPFADVNNVWNQWKFFSFAREMLFPFRQCRCHCFFFSSHSTAHLSRALSSLESPRSFHDLRPMLWHQWAGTQRLLGRGKRARTLRWALKFRRGVRSSSEWERKQKQRKQNKSNEKLVEKKRIREKFFMRKLCH